MSISKEQADELKRLARESSPKGTYLAYGQLLDYIDSLTGKDEPVAWLSTAGSLWKTRAFQDDTPLYAAPQPPMQQRETSCRSDGRCQYAIDHGAECIGACPKGECAYALAIPDAPHECKTDAEKQAFAFGWFKALETVQQRKPMTDEDMVRLIARTFNSVERVDRESLSCALVRAVERYYGIGD